MMHVHLATALVRRGDRVLLVASRYPNHEHPLWNLPGGRQEAGELLAQTALRELQEETGLSGTIRDLCYVSESYDAQTGVHFVNAAFAVDAPGEPGHSYAQGDHVVETAWAPLADLPQRLVVAVVREPLLAYLEREARYAGYPDAGITIEFPD